MTKSTGNETNQIHSGPPAPDAPVKSTERPLPPNSNLPYCPLCRRKKTVVRQENSEPETPGAVCYRCKYCGHHFEVK